MTVRQQPERIRIGELAERAGVSVATVKYYIREGLLPPPPIKTGRTMAYYDAAYLDRLRLIRTLREQHYLPVRAIRTILSERGDRALGPVEAEIVARIGPSVVRRLAGRSAEVPPDLTRAQILERYHLGADELDLLEEMGLVGDGGAYSQADLDLLEAMQRVEAAGLDRDHFPIEGLGHYVELLGELARREVRRFSHAAETLPISDVEELAERALTVSEPVVALIRRKLILRALQEEVTRQQKEPK